ARSRRREQRHLLRLRRCRAHTASLIGPHCKSLRVVRLAFLTQQRRRMELQARTLTGEPIGLDQTIVTEFARKLRGELIRPGDAAYEAARQVYNGMISRHPALIAQCVDTADVVSCVDFARNNRLLVSVRG